MPSFSLTYCLRECSYHQLVDHFWACMCLLPEYQLSTYWIFLSLEDWIFCFLRNYFSTNYNDQLGSKLKYFHEHQGLARSFVLFWDKLNEKLITFRACSRSHGPIGSIFLPEFLVVAWTRVFFLFQIDVAHGGDFLCKNKFTSREYRGVKPLLDFLLISMKEAILYVFEGGTTCKGFLLNSRSVFLPYPKHE